MKNPDQLDINRVEKNERTALHLAAMFGSVDVLRVLLAITEDSPKTFTQKKDSKLRDSRILNVNPTEVRTRCASIHRLTAICKLDIGLFLP